MGTRIHRLLPLHLAADLPLFSLSSSFSASFIAVAAAVALLHHLPPLLSCSLFLPVAFAIDRLPPSSLSPHHRRPLPSSLTTTDHHLFPILPRDRCHVFLCFLQLRSRSASTASSRRRPHFPSPGSSPIRQWELGSTVCSPSASVADHPPFTDVAVLSLSSIGDLPCLFSFGADPSTTRFYCRAPPTPLPSSPVMFTMASPASPLHPRFTIGSCSTLMPDAAVTSTSSPPPWPLLTSVAACCCCQHRRRRHPSCRPW